MIDGAGMDIDALHSALVSLTLLPEEVRSARENLLTSAGNGIALAKFLSEMERDLRITKAAVARELGFRLCKCCWPPEIMAPGSEGALVCATRLEDPLSRVESIVLSEPVARNGSATDERMNSFATFPRPELGPLHDRAADWVPAR
ncbi:hypothetical protein BH18VER1_BH18VER1_02130 [soil metagenome]